MAFNASVEAGSVRERLHDRENPSLALDHQQQAVPDPTRHREVDRRSPPSHVIHTVRRTDNHWPNGPTNFLNRVCSETGPGNDQVNEPEAQGKHVTTGTPPKATLRDHPPVTGRHLNKYKRASVLRAETHRFVLNRARGVHGASCGIRGVEGHELARGAGGRTRGKASVEVPL